MSPSFTVHPESSRRRRNPIFVKIHERTVDYPLENFSLRGSNKRCTTDIALAAIFAFPCNGFCAVRLDQSGTRTNALVGWQPLVVARLWTRDECQNVRSISAILCAQRLQSFTQNWVDQNKENQAYFDVEGIYFYTDSYSRCQSLYLSFSCLADGLVCFNAASTSSVFTGSITRLGSGVERPCSSSALQK